jgi:hypothetical protein
MITRKTINFYVNILRNFKKLKVLSWEAENVIVISYAVQDDQI